MNIHEKMESIADLYVAGGLNADERREADQHAAGCARAPRCSATRAIFRRGPAGQSPPTRRPPTSRTA
jgi:hypothetical protein